MRKKLLSLALAAAMLTATALPCAAEEAQAQPAEPLQIVETVVDEQTTDETAVTAEKPEAIPVPIEKSQEDGGQVETHSDIAPGDSGQCGDNVYWTLDADGVLTISGSGAMWDWDYWLEEKPSPFYQQQSINAVVIENGVTSIGDEAYRGCSSITDITIPSSVTSIGITAFRDCSGLTNITIPSSVTSIGHSAFYYCGGLNSITIPSSVTSIGRYAFGCCRSLTSITIPSSVTSIGGGAFFHCSGLTSITIPSSVTGILDCTFDGCSGLTSITIPSSVTSVDWSAFYDCNSLKDVYYTGTQAEWNAISIDSYGNSALTDAAIHFEKKVEDAVNYISKDKIGIVAVDSQGRAIPNASVTINGTYAGQTDENGCCLYTYPESGQIIVKVAAEGYFVVQTSRKVTAGGTTCVQLKAESESDKDYEFAGIIMDDQYDVMSTKVPLYHDEESIHVNVFKPQIVSKNSTSPITKYKLVQVGGKVLAECTASDAEMPTLSVNLQKVAEAGKPILMIATSQDGKFSFTANTKISILSAPTSDLEGMSIEVGSKLALTIPKNVPIVGGNEISLDSTVKSPAKVVINENI